MYLTIIKNHIKNHGNLGTVRVSSAPSGTGYNYWGAVRYELRVSRDGRLIHAAQERASYDRRSERLAEKDAEAIAESEDRFELQSFGGCGENCAKRVYGWLTGVDVVACERLFGNMGMSA